MKINFNYKEYCREEYEFSSLSLDYLKKINKEGTALKYDELRKFFENVKIETEILSGDRIYA